MSEPTTESTKPERRYWFPAKRWGWGWGPPTMWQGWVVLAVWVAAMTFGALRLARNLTLYVPFIAIMAGVLIAICYAKGEPPGWRSGGRRRDQDR